MPDILPAFPQARLIHHLKDSPLPRFFQSLPNAWCLTVVSEGKVTFFADGTRYTAASGDLLLFPPLICHAVLPQSDETRFASIFYTAEPAPAAETDVFLCSVQAHTEMLSLLQLLQEPSLLPDARDRLLESLLIQSGALPCARLSPLHIETAPAHILEYLNGHFHEDISLSDLSSAFHLTPSHIIHIFKQVYGLSPIQYLIQRRIGEAQRLLLTSDLSIGKVAASVGIFNRNYFYSTFKKLVGITPTLYRDAFGIPTASRIPGSGTA